VAIREWAFWERRNEFVRKLVKCVARNKEDRTHELVASKCRQLNKIM